MPVKKKYEDEFKIGGSPADNLALATTALERAGFKKVSADVRLYRVTGNWKPLVGTLWGDITVTLVADGSNTLVQLLSVAAVDNIYAAAKSPGYRIFEKFLSEFSPVTTPASGESSSSTQSTGDVSEKLAELLKMHQAGHLSDAEFEAAKKSILGL
jgi:hypothetical protein